MWPLPSAERGRLQPVLLWTGVALAVFLAFRLLLPPKPAAAPFVATLGFLLVAAVLYSMRGRIFVRSAAFAFVGAAAYLFAWNRGVPMLYAFSAACLAIVVVSHLLPRWALRLVEGRVSAPAWISQGDSAQLRIVAANPSPATVRMLELEVPVEGALAEPARARGLLVQLAGGATREIPMRSPPLARGRRFAGPLRLRTGFPLGLAFAEAEVAASGQHVWVYPRLFNIGYVPIAGEQFLDMGDAISPRSGGVEDFAGVREYRHGDSRRHVHWRASARRGELVVKEFMRRSAATVTIALDLSKKAVCGTGIESTVEYAVRAAASVTRYALEQGHYVQLALCGSKFELIGPLHGRGDLEEALRALALAQADGEQFFAAWLPRVLTAAPEDSTLVAIYTEATTRPVPTSAFNRRGVLVVPVVVDAQSFVPSAAKVTVRGQAPRGRERRLRKGEDLEAVFRR